MTKTLIKPSESPPSGEPTPQRPLSPHLQIYRFQLTSILSILHRLSGMLLSLAVVLLIVGTVMLAQGPRAYENYVSCFDYVVTRGLVFLILFALMYHFWNGLRHLLWDMGWGLDLRTTYRTGWGVIGLTMVSVLFYLLWVLV